MKVIIANLLREGLVVYLTDEEQWDADLQRAAVAQTDEQERALLNTAATHVADNRIVGPESIEVTRNTDGRLRPVRLRERIRSDGPTIEVGPARPRGGHDVSVR